MSGPAAPGGPDRRQSLSQLACGLRSRDTCRSRNGSPDITGIGFVFDLMAGITSWAVMVPVALGYAGSRAYRRRWGSSRRSLPWRVRDLGHEPARQGHESSTMAVMSASVIGPSRGKRRSLPRAEGGLALTSARSSWPAGLARLGLHRRLPLEVGRHGFMFGLAITVVVGQLPKLLGGPGVSGTVPSSWCNSSAAAGHEPLDARCRGIALVASWSCGARFRVPGPARRPSSGSSRCRCSISTPGVTSWGRDRHPTPAPAGRRPCRPAVPRSGCGRHRVPRHWASPSAAVAHRGASGLRVEPDQELVGLGAANVASRAVRGLRGRRALVPDRDGRVRRGEDPGVVDGDLRADPGHGDLPRAGLPEPAATQFSLRS